jgi:hypothetical protein
VHAAGAPGPEYLTKSLRGSFLVDLDGQRRTYQRKGKSIPYGDKALGDMFWAIKGLWGKEQAWRIAGDMMEQESGQGKETIPTDDPQKVALE